jgi:hypothetical protein
VSLGSGVEVEKPEREAAAMYIYKAIPFAALALAEARSGRLQTLANQS